MEDFDKFLQRIPSWVRWILILPGSLIAAALVMLVNQVMYYISLMMPFGWLDAWTIVPFAFGAATAIFIIAGATIAPAGRKGVAVILALFPIAIIVVNVASRIAGASDPSWPLWQMILDTIGMTIGVFVGVASAFTIGKPEYAS